MTPSSSTRVALTSAAALAAVGIASLVLTFARADAGSDVAAGTVPTQPAAPAVAPPSTMPLATTTTTTTTTPTTTTTTTTTTTPRCAPAPYLVIEMSAEPAETPSAPGDLPEMRSDGCLMFEPTVQHVGRVVGAFASRQDACDMLRGADAAQRDSWTPIATPTTQPSSGITRPPIPGLGQDGRHLPDLVEPGPPVTLECNQ